MEEEGRLWVKNFKEILQELKGSRVLQVKLHQDRLGTLYGITIITTDGYEVVIGISHEIERIGVWDNTGKDIK